MVSRLKHSIDLKLRLFTADGTFRKKVHHFLKCLWSLGLSVFALEFFGVEFKFGFLLDVRGDDGAIWLMLAL